MIPLDEFPINKSHFFIRFKYSSWPKDFLKYELSFILQKDLIFLRIYSEFSSKFGAEKKNLVSLNFDIDLNISLTSFIFFFLDIVLGWIDTRIFFL